MYQCPVCSSQLVNAPDYHAVNKWGDPTIVMAYVKCDQFYVMAEGGNLVAVEAFENPDVGT
jgi:hypothetical protein